MVEILGIGGVTGPAEKSPDRARTAARTKTTIFGATDGVKISAAAQQAAAAQHESEIRQQKIEEVKARLEEGTYKLQATVLLVAARVSPYVG